jgi:DNA-binding response OmpR family regulator
MQSTLPAPLPAARTGAAVKQGPLHGSVLLAIAPGDVAHYPSGALTVTPVHTTGEAIHALERLRPHIVVIDWDLATLDAPSICRHAAQRPATTILIATDAPDRVPAALRCGCHAVLLKPFSVNLASARIGRILREATIRQVATLRHVFAQGTNRTWPGTPCPACTAMGAVSFDFASHRQSWYACGSCDHVWRGRRQE